MNTTGVKARRKGRKSRVEVKRENRHKKLAGSSLSKYQQRLANKWVTDNRLLFMTLG